MKHRIPLYILAFLLIPFFSRGQRVLIDSFLRVEANAKQDSDRLKAEVGLAGAYFSVKPDSFFFYCKKGIALAKDLGRVRYQIQLDHKMSGMLTDTGNYPLALKYAEESLALAQKINSQPLIIDSYIEIGRTYDFQSDFVHSSEFFFSAWAIAKEINDHARLALIGTNLAAGAFNQGDYKKAEDFSLLTIKEAEISKQPLHQSKAYQILALCKATTGDTAAAEVNYRAAIEVCKKGGYLLDEAGVLSDLAMVQKKDEKKLSLLMEARSIYDSLSPAAFDSRMNWEDLSQVYLKMYKSDPARTQYLSSAEQYVDKLIKKSRESRDMATVAQGLELLSQVQAARQHYKEAYAYNIEFHSLNDSIFSQEHKNKIAALESRNEIDKKNQEIENQRRQVAEQKKNVYLLVGGLLLVSAIGFLFFRISRIRKQKNDQLSELNRRLEDANKLKIKFFGILSHDLRGPVANLVNFLTLQKIDPHALTRDEKEAHDEKVGDSARGLLETMEDLLLWSKSQMDQFKADKTTVYASDLFHYLQRNFGGNKGLALVFLDEERIRVVTDENVLKTIMFNLTANAVKALAGRNDGMIKWTVRSENGKIVFSVADNGPGIEEGKLKALYDDTVVSSSKTGLGLHIIRDLARALHLNISLNPTYKNGTEFLLTVNP